MLSTHVQTQYTEFIYTYSTHMCRLVVSECSIDQSWGE